MNRPATLAAVLLLALAVPACGRYGPPVRPPRPGPAAAPAPSPAAPTTGDKSDEPIEPEP